MSITAKRTATYSATIFLVFAILAFIPICLFAQEAAHPFATAQAEPLPWWRQVEDFQNLAVKWVGALTMVLGALATLCAFMIAKYQEIASRLNRQEERHEKAMEAAKPKEVIVTNDDKHPVPTTTPPTLPLVIVGALFLFSGCAGGRLDTDFRRKVQAIDVATTGGYDPLTGGVSGGISGHFVLRDPDAKTIKPLR